MSDHATPITNQARWFGYAGLAPQFFILLYATQGAENLWIGQAAGFGYAAAIFSFLGGVWWGLGLNNPKAPRWLFGAAVLPSLIAVAAFLPWVWGFEWPIPSLIILGLGLLASPLVDHAIARHMELPDGWLKLRTHLSTGLGLSTLALCLL